MVQSASKKGAGLSTNSDRLADRLTEARRTGVPAQWRDVLLQDRAAAYAVQDAVIATLGPITAWKVGAPYPDAEPTCAPCPAAGVFKAGSTFVGPQWRLRGVEVEVGLRLARDLPGGSSVADCLRAVDAVVPIVEIVETRLADWGESDPLTKLADFASHGALVIGPPSNIAPSALDLRDLRAELLFDDHVIVATHGGNPAGDVWRLLVWLAAKASAQGRPLRPGDVVTTGSCTGMHFAKAGTRVTARVADIGDVALDF